MSYFKAKMHQIRFRYLAELTALPQTLWLDLRGPTSKGRGGQGREEQGKGRRRKGRKWGRKGREKGREGKEGKGKGKVASWFLGDGRPWSMVFQKLLKILWRSSSVNKQQERTQAHRLESHLGPKSRGGRSGNSPSSFKMEEQYIALRLHPKFLHLVAILEPCTAVTHAIARFVPSVCCT